MEYTLKVERFQGELFASVCSTSQRVAIEKITPQGDLVFAVEADACIQGSVFADLIKKTEEEAVRRGIDPKTINHLDELH